MAYFSPLQHGVATPGEPELIYDHIHIQVLIEQHPTWSILKTYVSNAFNSIVIHEVAAQFPELLNHVFQMYGITSSLV